MESGAVRAWPLQGSNTGRNAKVLPEDGVDPGGGGEKPVCVTHAIQRRAWAVVAYLPRWLLGSIMVAGRGVRPTVDRSVVVRTFQLESGVSLEKEGERRDRY